MFFYTPETLFLGERFDAFPIGWHAVLNKIGDAFQIKLGRFVCRILAENLLKMVSGRGKLLVVVISGGVGVLVYSGLVFLLDLRDAKSLRDIFPKRQKIS